MIATGTCERCGKVFEADSRRARTKRFCSPACRYDSWLDKREEELRKMIRDFAKRGGQL